MYDFFYGFLKPKHGDMYTNTDYVILNVITDNFYDDIKQNMHYFYTSNYKLDNIHSSKVIRC